MGKIVTSELVKMSADQMASVQMSKWRNQTEKTELDLIEVRGFEFMRANLYVDSFATHLVS